MLIKAERQKWGMVFYQRSDGNERGDKKKKPPGFDRGFFKELEFKVFGRTVNQAGFSGILVVSVILDISNIVMLLKRPKTHYTLNFNS